MVKLSLSFVILTLLSQVTYARNPDLADSEVPTYCLTLKQGKEEACARLPAADAACGAGLLAFIKGSCVIEKGFTLIPGFDQKGLTITKEMQEKYSSTVIAENLVYRFYKMNEVPQLSDEVFNKPAYPYHQRLDIQIAFYLRDLDSIAANGFLNQHETGKSGGSLTQSRRFSVEKNMLNFGMDYDDPSSKKILPKYSFGVPTQVSSEKFPFHHYVAQYGNVIAVLNDAVRKRSTFTAEDSLGLDFSSAAPSPLHSFYWLDKIIQQSDYSYYWEVQIWGELKFSDAKYLIVGCFDNKDLSESELNYLYEKTSLHIYACKVENYDAGHQRYTKGRQLR